MTLWAWSLVPILMQDPYLPKTPPFADIPPQHWAASAVQMLKDDGILVGYPPAKIDASPAALDAAMRRLRRECGIESHPHQRGPLSRYEAAVLLYAFVKIWEGRQSENPESSALEPYWRNRSMVYAYIGELEKELDSLDVDARQLRCTLIRLAVVTSQAKRK